MEISATTTVLQELLKLMNYHCQSIREYQHPELHIPICAIVLEENISDQLLHEITPALQTLTRSILLHKDKTLSEDNLLTTTLDINNVLTQLIDRLRVTAHTYADRAMTFGVPVRMDPLPAFHRKIVHTFLQQVPGIRTESYGTGSDRYIMVSVSSEITDQLSAAENYPLK